MNVCRGRPKYRSFRILIDSRCSSTIINGRITKTLRHKYAPVKSSKWSAQAGNFMTNYAVKIEFSLHLLSGSKIVTRKCHVDDSTLLYMGISHSTLT